MFSLILADDFSGACDTAARAWPGSAALLAPPWEAPGADILALSTETRHASAAGARALIRALAPQLTGRALYKKIDSTLRGPWIAEVDEILQVTEYSQAVVCPAFPAQGRTVQGGWLYLDGKPLQRIECPFTVRDAATEDDLKRLASEICSSILPVGSAGLARHLFRSAPDRLPLTPDPRRSLWLVLVGSDHPVSRQQLLVLREAGLPNVVVNPELDPGEPGGVFATGGETAARFLRRHQARGLSDLREVLPGVPAGRILGGRYNGLRMILKAGGFGAPDTIVRALQALS